MSASARRSGSGLFSVAARDPFSFAASVRFLEGFPPAQDPTTADGGLRLAFCVPSTSSESIRSRFASLGDADPVVGRLQRHFDGLRPVGFWSAEVMTS